jgi:hypothetical protein
MVLSFTMIVSVNHTSSYAGESSITSCT